MAQNDLKKWWFLLDSAHGNYAAIIANLSALATLHGETYTNVAGRNANERVVYSYMTAAEKAASSPSLTISTSGCVKDAYNYQPCYNAKYAAPTLYTDPVYGDSTIAYGSFLENPQALPTDGVDRIVEYIKGNGTDTPLWLAQTARGTGSGSSWRNAKAIIDVLSDNGGANATYNPTAHSMLIFADDVFSRFRDQGAPRNDLVPTSAGVIAIFIKNGSVGERTVLLAHPCHTAYLMGGSKMGCGKDGEDADWTLDVGTTYLLNHPSTYVSTGNYYVMSTAGGTAPRPLTKVASIAACRALTDSYYPGDIITYVNNGVGNPHTTTYFGGVWSGITPYIGSKSYFDSYGIHYRLQGFGGSVHAYSENYRFIGGSIRYAGSAVLFTVAQVFVHQFTGQFIDGLNFELHVKPDYPANRQWLGVHFGHQRAVLYDTNFHSLVPTDTVARDCYVEGTGSNEYGINIADDDAHSFASLGGFDECTLRNIRYENCGNKTNVLYPSNTAHYNRNTTQHDGAITNGTFAADANWTKTGGATISGGKANFPGTIEQAVTIGAGYVRVHGAAATATASNIVALDGSPDLSAVVGKLVHIPGATRKTSQVVSANNVAKTIVVDGDPITITGSSAWAIGMSTVLRFTVTPFGSQLTVQVGTTSGASDVFTTKSGQTFDFDSGSVTVTSDSVDGIAAIAFIPISTTFYVQFTSAGAVSIDNVSLPVNLAGEAGYLLGFPEANEWYDSVVNFGSANQASYYVMQPEKFDITHSWFRNPILNAVNPTIGIGEACISMTGNLTYGYGDAIEVTVKYNRLEGIYPYGVRCKWQQPSPYDETLIESSYNMVLGAERGLYLYNNSVDENGNTVEASFWHHHNQIYASLGPYTEFSDPIFVYDSNIANPTRRRVISDDNKFLTGASPAAKWHGGADQTTLASFRAAAGANDDYDDASTTGTLHISAGTATVAISGTPGNGNTLTAVPSGTKFNESYMWLRDGEEIGTGATYVWTAKDGAASGVKVVMMYQDISGLTNLATGWNLSESSTVTASGGSGGMGADTAAKRYSAMNMACPWRGLNVIPSGTINDSERAAVMYLYSGFDYAGDDGSGGGGGPGAKRGGFLVNIGKMMT